jgi:hypothetical protein
MSKSQTERNVERRAKAELMRQDRLRRERLARIRVAGVVAVAVAVIVGAVIWATGQAGNSAATPTMIGLKTFTGLSRAHVAGKVNYPQTPPVGGDHSAAWQNCGYYPTSIASENGVHSLEHGAAWITYSPNLSSGDRARLSAEFATRPYVLVSEYPGLPSPVVASAWGYQVDLSGVSDPRLKQFVTRFANSPKAPEPGGECAGGVGSPQ